MTAVLPWLKRPETRLKLLIAALLAAAYLVGLGYGA